MNKDSCPACDELYDELQDSKAEVVRLREYLRDAQLVIIGHRGMNNGFVTELTKVLGGE